MAVLGVELGLSVDYDGTDFQGNVVANGVDPLHLGAFTREGSHTEPTIGQIWPR